MKLKARGEGGERGESHHGENRRRQRLGDSEPCGGTDGGPRRNGCDFLMHGRTREWSGGDSRKGGDGLGSFIEAGARGKTLPRREVGAAAVAA